jgi:hypothetical protein
MIVFRAVVHWQEHERLAPALWQLTMTARLALRLIAAACALIAAPLMLIVISWLPALVLSVRDYDQARNISGTLSFHRDMATHLKQAIITVGILAGSAAVWVSYVFMAIDPRPKRDQFVWLFGTAIISVYFVDTASLLRSMNRDGALLFGAIPMLLGVLSLAGM